MADQDDASGADSLEAGLRAVFQERFAARPEDSVLSVLERKSGLRSRVLLRDLPDEHSPLLRVPSPQSEHAFRGDRRYEVVGEIARGGVGVIHKGRDRDLGRDVAIKVLRKELADRPEIVQRFIEEAQVEGQLQHPGIIPVHGLGLQPDGRPYFAMKLVKGETLSSHLDGRCDPADDRRRYLGVFEKIAQTMAYAHARGVVHRDIKPSNILLGAFGEVLIIDWGFAKVLGQEEPEPDPESPPQTIIATVRSGDTGSHSVAGSVMGTPAYMPPEQALGRIDDLDERADVFSLGAVLCEILTGKPPYAGDRTEVLASAARADLADAHARLHACGADESAVDLARRCLSPSRSDRPRDAGAVSRAITEELAAAEDRARAAEIARREARAAAEEEREKEAQAALRAEEERARAAAAAAEAGRQREEEAEATKQARHERQSRRRTVAVAAGVLVALLIGAGAFVVLDQQRAARRETTEREVAAILAEAAEHEGREEWAPAVAKAREALDLARVGEAGEAVRARAHSAVAALEEQQRAARESAARIRRDRELVAALTRTFERSGEFEDRAEFQNRLLAAFQEWGLDLDDATLDEATRAVQAAEDPLAIALLLDRWAASLFIDDAKDPHLAMALAIAESVDPDPWRNRLRDVFARNDRAGLDELVRTVDLASVGPASLKPLSRVLFLERRYEDLVRILEGAVIRHPGSYTVHTDLSVALSAHQPPDHEGALRHALAARALRPERPREWQRVGQVLSLQQRGRETAAAFEHALEIAPDFAPARESLGTLRLNQGRPQEAVREFEEAIRLGLDRGQLWVNLAQARAGSGDPEGSRAAYEESLVRLRHEVAGRSAHLPSLLGSLGLALHALGEHAEAREVLEQALDIEPENAFNRWRLALVLLAVADLDAAEATVAEGLTLAPADLRGGQSRALLLRVRSGIHFRREEYEEARDDLREAVKLTPDAPGPWLNLAGVTSRVGSREERREALRALTHQCPSATALVVIAHYLAQLGDEAGARETRLEATRAVAAATAKEPGNDRDWEAWCNALRLRPRLRTVDEWQTMAHRLLEAGPPRSDLLHAFGAALSDFFYDHALARLLLTEAVRHSPDAVRPRLLLSRVLHRCGDEAAALAGAETLAEERPEVAEVRWQLSLLLLSARRYREAREHVEAAIQLDPGATVRPQLETVLKAARDRERLAPELSALLAGARQPESNEECIVFAELCLDAGHAAEALALYRSALAAEPGLAVDEHLDVATAAVLAGERSAALAWLRTKLEALRKTEETVATGEADPRLVIAHWFYNPDFRSVREADALAELPPDEQETWTTFWKEADQLLRQAQDEE